MPIRFYPNPHQDSLIAQFKFQGTDPNAKFGKIKTAATYSRASYTGTTIGNAVFDGRVRDGIGSDHCFMATVKSV